MQSLKDPVMCDLDERSSPRGLRDGVFTKPHRARHCWCYCCFSLVVVATILLLQLLPLCISSTSTTSISDILSLPPPSQQAQCQKPHLGTKTEEERKRRKNELCSLPVCFLAKARSPCIEKTSGDTAKSGQRDRKALRSIPRAHKSADQVCVCRQGEVEQAGQPVNKQCKALLHHHNAGRHCSHKALPFPLTCALLVSTLRASFEYPNGPSNQSQSGACDSYARKQKI